MFPRAWSLGHVPFRRRGRELCVWDKSVFGGRPQGGGILETRTESLHMINPTSMI